MTRATAIAGSCRSYARSMAWLALLCTALAGLNGCTSTGPGGSGGREILTESDEGEARKRARIRMDLALGYFEQGKTDIALDEVKQVIAADPSFPAAYALRGLIFMRLNDTRQAEDSFRRAVALNPRDADTLHNYGWLLCQQNRHEEAQRSFESAMSNVTYAGRAKTLMAQGICHARAGRTEDAERSLARSHELDATNPVTGYNLANLLYRKGDYSKAQSYIRRLNNSEYANAETLWLGIKVERRLNDSTAMRQLGEQLKKRFAQSREATSYDRGSFDE